jgi:hypothetical protein
MTVESGLRAILAAESTISAIVGSKVFDEKVDVEDSPPYVRFEHSAEVDETLGGDRSADFNLECVQTTAPLRNTLTKAVRDFIQDYSGAADDVTIDAVLIVDEDNDYEEPQHGSDSGRFIGNIEIKVFYS